MFPDSIVQKGKWEVFCYCPNLCNTSKRKLQVNVSRNVYKCWVCGEKQTGSVFRLLRLYANEKQRSKYFKTVEFVPKHEEEERPEVSVVLPQEYKFLFNETNLDLRSKALEYLAQQGIKDEDIVQFKIGTCSSGKYYNRIVYPSFDKDGSLNYFITRSLDDGHRKKYLDCDQHKSKIIFNEYAIDWDRPVILVENVKAHIKHKIVPNVVPILGLLRISDKYRLLQQLILNDCKKIYLALDSDSRLKTLKIMYQLYRHDVSTNYVDLGLENQPENLTTYDFVTAIENSRPFNKTEFLKSQILNA